MKCEGTLSCFNQPEARVVYVRRRECNSPEAQQHTACVCGPCLEYMSGVPLICILRSAELKQSEAAT